MKNVTLTILILVMLVFGGVANAALVTVEDFSFFCATGLSGQSIRMSTGDNLMIRDPLTGLDSVVSTDGYWNMGFLSDDTGMIGWAKNSWKQYSGYEGQMRGNYYADLGVGNAPDEVYLVHDQNGDGIGVFDDSSGILTFGDDDVFYAYDFLGGIWDASPNILFGPDEVRGDLSYLPEYTGTSAILVLPSMTISVIPEPATMLLLGLGSVFLRRRQK